MHVQRRHMVSVGHPGMLQRLCGCEALFGVDAQQRPAEARRLLRHVLPPLRLHRVQALADLLALHLLGTAKRHVARQQHEDNHAETPEIALFRVRSVQDLWGHIGQSATAHLHHDVVFVNLAEPKVYQLQMIAALLVVQKVFQLEIPVHNVTAVDVVQRQEHLPGGVGRIALGEPLQLCDTIKQLTTFHTLHDQVDVLLGLVDVHEARNMRVIHGQVDLHLRGELLPLFPGHVPYFEQLHGEEFVACPTRGKLHDAVEPRSQHL
mmetsp:Transcript_32777/g.87991  ORF Transcript_32777/g.87991 Transcript_32777/m.87991 type:complete len:264 (+) Transcript_32777:827-1618(+)